METFATQLGGRQLISEHFVRITLGPIGLENFESTGIADEYVRLMVPHNDETLPRVYTIRNIHPDKSIDLDIVIHEGGIGSNWALTAPAGSPIEITAPHGLYRPKDTAKEQFFIADITGIPAVARILENLDPHITAHVDVVITDPRDIIDLPTGPNIDVRWHRAASEQHIANVLENIVRTRPISNRTTYVWVAGEGKASRGSRKYLRKELLWEQTDFYTCGYWQFNAEAWEARYAEVADSIEAEAMELWRTWAERDEGRYLDEIDELFERVGL